MKSNLCLILPSTRREDFSVEKKSTEDDWGGGGEAGVLLPDKSCHPRRPRSLTCQTQLSELTHSNNNILSAQPTLTTIYNQRSKGF